jgi:aspartate aminotransferase
MRQLAVASRVSRIKESPSGAAAERVRRLRAAGERVLSLTVGEPDFDTPEHILRAAVAALEAGATKYTSVNGTPELRRAILDRVERRTGARYSAGELAVGVGGKQVIFMALMATLNEGDEVIIPAPYWVSYPDMVLANDGTPVVVAAKEEHGFKLTAEQLRSAITDRTRWLILNTPSNPTGAVYTDDELLAIAGVLTDFPDVWVLTDEIYDEIYFGDGKAMSLIEAAPALRDRVFYVNGVSKAYAMTGWRIGYGVGPEVLVSPINTLLSQISSCPAAVSQAAAAAALDGDQSFIPESVAVYRRRRDLCVSGFGAIEGLSCIAPDGAFYLYVGCAAILGKVAEDGTTLLTDEDVTTYLLDAAKVAVVQGSAYGLSPYFRVSFATDDDTLREAIEAVRDALARLR